MTVLGFKCGFQIQYQTIFCIWLLAFTPEIALKMNQYNPVPVLADILGEAAKEKVTRIVAATFRVSLMFCLFSQVIDPFIYR